MLGVTPGNPPSVALLFVNHRTTMPMINSTKTVGRRSSILPLSQPQLHKVRCRRWTMSVDRAGRGEIKGS